MTGKRYVHGYSHGESERLLDQAETLINLLHNDTLYPPGSLVLEVGCGVGAQTGTLAHQSPGATIISVDVSWTSIRQAWECIKREGTENVLFSQADIYRLPFPPASFDHAFVCFLLEHLPDPHEALTCLRDVIRPGGTLTVIEGDHGSAYFYPDNQYAKKAIDALVTLQHEMGGNALIGRQLYPLLVKAGFSDVVVSPRMVYVDASRPDLVEGFTRQTFTAMVEGVGKTVCERGMMGREEWGEGILGLNRTCEPDGVFCYTFFKATGKN